MHLQCLVSMSSTHLLFHSFIARKVWTWLTYQLWITITETNQVLAFQLGLLRSLANSVKCFCLQVALTLSPTNTITPQKNWHWQTFHAQKFLVTLNLCFFGHFSWKRITVMWGLRLFYKTQIKYLSKIIILDFMI